MPVQKKNISFFKNNGFLKVSNFFTINEIKLLKKYVYQIHELVPKKGKEMIYFDTKGKRVFLTRTENFVKYNKKFNCLICT